MQLCVHCDSSLKYSFWVVCFVGQLGQDTLVLSWNKNCSMATSAAVCTWSYRYSWVPHTHWFMMWSEGLRGFGCVKLMIHTEVWIWVFALFPFHSLENPLHTTWHRLRDNMIWYDVSSTGPSLFLSVTHSFLSFRISACRFTLPSAVLPKPCWLVFILPPSLLLFSSFLILILVSVFSEGGPCLTFVLLCNEQMPAVNVFLAPCLRDSCQTQSKRGDPASHYFIADDQQCGD